MKTQTAWAIFFLFLCYKISQLDESRRSELLGSVKEGFESIAADPVGSASTYWENLQRSGGLNLIIAAVGAKLISWNIKRKRNRKTEQQKNAEEGNQVNTQELKKD